jgi:integrase
MARAVWPAWAPRRETGVGEDDLVFTAERGGRIDQSNLMSDVLKPAAVEAGLGDWVVAGNRRVARTWVGFHTFRHTCATLLFRNGWNAVQVQKFLGHTDPGFTLRTYVHLLPE